VVSLAGLAFAVLLGKGARRRHRRLQRRNTAAAPAAADDDDDEPPVSFLYIYSLN